jgi:tetratricopeptide (TPR) repeat protein
MKRKPPGFVFPAIAFFLFHSILQGATDWMAFGLQNLKSSRYEAAVAAFSKALQENPNLVKALNGRGFVRQRMGEHEQAVSDFTKALEIDPDYHLAFHNRGISRFYQARYDEAIGDFTRALELNSKMDLSFFNRGTAWLYKGNYEQAVSDYFKTLELNPESHRAMNQLAWIFATCPLKEYRNSRMALGFAKKALLVKIEPGLFDTLAAAYAEDGNFEKAIETQKMAIVWCEKWGDTKNLSHYLIRLETYGSQVPWRQKYVSREPSANIQYKEAIPPKGASASKKINAPSAWQGTLPYTIQIGAYQDEQQAFRIAKKLRQRRSPAFTSAGEVKERGRWFRIFVGSYHASNDARQDLERLRHQGFPHAYIVRMPYSVEVIVDQSNKDLKTLEAELEAKGLTTHRSPGKDHNAPPRVLTGAFKSRNEALKLLKRLEAEGFRSRVIQR